ncbi:MAG: hypothetical protein ACOYN2_01595 [Patescibacteria group bacterium]
MTQQSKDLESISSDPIYGEQFNHLLATKPEVAQVLAEYVVYKPIIREHLLKFIPFLQETERIPKLRKFIEIMLTYPPTMAGERELNTFFWEHGGPLSDERLVPEFSDKSQSRLFWESSQLMSEILEFGMGFSNYGNVSFWRQIYKAFEKCLGADDPNDLWIEALNSEGLTAEQMDDYDFLDHYYDI